MRHRQRFFAMLGVLSVTLIGAAVPALAADEPAASVGAAEDENLPGVPKKGAPRVEWEEWVERDRASVEAMDWAGQSAAKGCTLLEVSIVDEIDPGYNLSMGAPADLVTVRVDLSETCEVAAGARLVPTIAPMSVPAGPQQCNSQTHGPGTICIYKSGGRVYSSWNYRGSGAVTGYMRIYMIDTAAIGCPTGTTWHTGAAQAWSTNTTNTTSKAQTQSAAYSAHIWKHNGAASYSDWGQTCAVL